MHFTCTILLQNNHVENQKGQKIFKKIKKNQLIKKYFLNILNFFGFNCNKTPKKQKFFKIKLKLISDLSRAKPKGCHQVEI